MAGSTTERLAALAVLFLLMVVGSAAAQTTAVEARGHFAEGHHLSGAACATPLTCVVASDESHAVMPFTVDGTVIVPGGPLWLPAHHEIDIEGVTYADGFYYLVGSHGMSRKKGELELSRFAVYRVAADPETHLPRADSAAEHPADVAIAALREQIRRAPRLSDYAETRLQKNGANIEGIAAKSGKLYFGFRAPSLDGSVPLLVVDAVALFGTAPVAAELRWLALGVGVGIRDLAPTSDGFLVLTGDAGSEPSGAWRSELTLGHPFEILRWDGVSEKATSLARLVVETGEKPEALALLEETATAYRVLVFSDGPANGRPTEISVAK